MPLSCMIRVKSVTIPPRNWGIDGDINAPPGRREFDRVGKHVKNDLNKPQAIGNDVGEVFRYVRGDDSDPPFRRALGNEW